MGDARDPAGPLKRRALAAAMAVALGAFPVVAARADRNPDRPPTPPTLVVVIAVDQMRGDYLDRFGAAFTGGLARLIREGAVFTDANQDHGFTETAPGHATLLSGRNPWSTGIIRNSEGVNDTTPLLEVPGPGASPRRFHGTALFDWMHARWPTARALSVSKKDRGAILPVGRSRQAVYWYEGGQFTTSRYYADTLPTWVRDFNQSAVPARAGGRMWTLLLDSSLYPEPDSMPYEGGGRDPVFPHRLPANDSVAARAFPGTPWMDSLTLAFALAGVQHLGLGRSAHPDLLAISLSATDYIGHAFGPDSRELHDQMLRLDRYLGQFLDSLARLRDPRRIVLVLTADHGVTPFPEWSRGHGDPEAGYVDTDSLVRRWRDQLNARAGAGAWIPWTEGGGITLDRAGLAARGVNVDSVIGLMRTDLLAVRGVAQLDTRRSLAAADTSADRFARRWRNALATGVPLELFVTLRPDMFLGRPGGGAQHGQPTDADTHVTLALWGAGIKPGTYRDRVSVADVAPTLASVLGVRPGEPVQGRVLREALR